MKKARITKPLPSLLDLDKLNTIFNLASFSCNEAAKLAAHD